MMKPVYPIVDIFDLSLLLKQWKRVGMTEIRSWRMLQLLLGRDFLDCMDDKYRYPYCNFNTIRGILKYNSNKSLLDDVIRSGVFVVLVDKNSDITHFYSPLWHRPDRDDGPSRLGSFKKKNNIAWDNYALSSLHQSLAESLQIEISRNILILNEVIKKEEHKEETKLRRGSSSKTLDEVLPENLQKVKDFFHVLNQDAALRREFFIPIIDEFEAKGYSRSQAKRMMIAMMEDHIQPYLARKEAFLEEGLFARITRLRNIYANSKDNWFRHIKGAATAKILDEERRDVEEARQRALDVHDTETHPYGVFESLSADGKRIYADPDEGNVVVPDGAPPRPSADAYYDFCNNQWIEQAI